MDAREGLVDALDFALHALGDLGAGVLLKVTHAQQLAVVGGDLAQAPLQGFQGKVAGGGFGPFGGEDIEGLRAETVVFALGASDGVDGPVARA